jgi:hypothetical protein
MRSICTHILAAVAGLAITRWRSAGDLDRQRVIELAKCAGNALCGRFNRGSRCFAQVVEHHAHQGCEKTGYPVSRKKATQAIA